jgi:hypothetical protein
MWQTVSIRCQERSYFKKLCATGGDIMQLIPFVHAFCAFDFPLFYNHHNREGDVIIIPFITKTHQGDPLGNSLFALVHLKLSI